MHNRDLSIVQQSLVFGGLAESPLRRLLRQAIIAEHGRGETLFRQGDPASHFFFVLDGWVKVYRLTRAGDESVVGVFTRGQSFAEAAAFTQGEYPASAETVAECRVMRVPTKDLTSLLYESPDLGLAMLASTSRQLHSLVKQIEQLKARTGTQRVAEFLSQLCPVEQGPCTIGLPYDKTLIAGRLGMKPESLSRAFARLRPLGVIIDHNTAAIRDVATLRDFLDEEQPDLGGELSLG